MKNESVQGDDKEKSIKVVFSIFIFMIKNVVYDPYFDNKTF